MSHAQSDGDRGSRTAFCLRVAPGDAGRRVDEFLAAELRIGRRAATRLARYALLNGRVAVKGARLAAGDEVRVRTDELSEAPPAAQFVLQVTTDLLVLDKPAGLPSVSLRGAAGDSLARWIAHAHPECAEIGAFGESGLVHRLDTQTSGVLLAARHAAAYAALRQQFAQRQVEKTYLAVVAGEVAETLRIAAPIGQHRKSRSRMRVRERMDDERYAAIPATTLAEPIAAAGAATLVRATTCSGARHQIRVHLAAAGFPLVGDATYGGPALAGIEAFLLHAESLRWRAPADAAPRTARVAPPSGWDAALARLRDGGRV